MLPPTGRQDSTKTIPVTTGPLMVMAFCDFFRGFYFRMTQNIQILKSRGSMNAICGVVARDPHSHYSLQNGHGHGHGLFILATYHKGK
jgi:hypothetical protein